MTTLVRLHSRLDCPLTEKADVNEYLVGDTYSRWAPMQQQRIRQVIKENGVTAVLFDETVMRANSVQLCSCVGSSRREQFRKVFIPLVQQISWEKNPPSSHPPVRRASPVKRKKTEEDKDASDE